MECRPDLDEQPWAERLKSVECQQRCSAGHPARPPFHHDHPSLPTHDRRPDRPALPQDLPSAGWFPASGDAAEVS